MNIRERVSILYGVSVVIGPSTLTRRILCLLFRAPYASTMKEVSARVFSITGSFHVLAGLFYELAGGVPWWRVFVDIPARLSVLLFFWFPVLVSRGDNE